MYCCQAVGCKGMTYPIMRPLQQASSLADSNKFFPRTNGSQAALHSSIMTQPRCEVRLYGNDSAPRALCLCSSHLNMAAGKINFAPIKPFDFSIAQPCKCANG